MYNFYNQKVVILIDEYDSPIQAGYRKFYDDRFSDCFGFTETEVKQILLDFEVTSDYGEIKKWYDGYKIGDTWDSYNPWLLRLNKQK